MTLSELIASSAARMEAAGLSFGHGTTNAFDEAAWLVLWRLGMPLDSDLEDSDVGGMRLDATQQAQADTLVKQRIDTRRPAAYLTGEAWLQGLRFVVDHRTIVPRSLIAELIADGTLDAWLPAEATRVLDLCTGGASLAILAASTWPDLHVDAADLSQDALAVATLNVSRHAVDARVTLLQGDGLAAAHGVYDLILCNPPYVNAHSMAHLPPEYRAEPELALAGGTDGMDFVRRLLRDAPPYLHPGAALVLEIGNERAYFEAAFPTLEALWMDTSAGSDQVCLLTREAIAAVQDNQP